MRELLVAMAHMAIFILFAVGFYLLLRSISLIEAAKLNMEKLMTQLYTHNDRRVSQIERQRRQYGTSANGKEGFFTGLLRKLDNLLIYSELSIKYEWLNASIYIILNIVLVAAVFLLAYILWGSFLGAVILAVTAVAAPLGYMSHLSNANYRQTEEQLKFFINVVSSNSMATNDIITVLEMSAPHIGNPIRNAVYRAVASSRVSGKSDDCIWQLTREMEHPLFVSFIRNLDICSKNDADYRNVAKDFAMQADQSIKELEKQRAIYSNSRVEISIMFVIGIVLSYMVCGFAENDLIGIIVEMSQSSIGIVCLLIECILFGSTLLYLLFGKRR